MKVDEVVVHAFLGMIAVHKNHVANVGVSARRLFCQRKGRYGFARVPDIQLQSTRKYRLRVGACVCVFLWVRRANFASAQSLQVGFVRRTSSADAIGIPFEALSLFTHFSSKASWLTALCAVSLRLPQKTHVGGDKSQRTHDHQGSIPLRRPSNTWVLTTVLPQLRCVVVCTESFRACIPGEIRGHG